MKKLLALILGAFLLFGSGIAEAGKRFSTIKLDLKRTVVLDGYVEDRTINPIINKIVEFDKISNKKIFLVIRSGGGYISSGNRLITTMVATEAPIIGVIDGYAYSMAAVIALYVDRLYMTETADIMFHEAKLCACGLEQHVRTRFFHFMKLLDKENSLIAAKLNMTLTDYKRAARGEFWLTADEAMTRGIAFGTVKGVAYPIPEQQRFRFFMSLDRTFIINGDDIWYGKFINGEKAFCEVP